jgi:hypothetical protein
MTDRSIKIFTLAEANSMVRQVADLTAGVVHHLDTIRQRHHVDTEKSGSAVPETVLKEVETALSEWSQQISDLGAQPKGYFTVDFQSIDPELLYCWTYGEERIEFTHKVWENFNHRRPLSADPAGMADHMKWVN